MSEPTHYKVSQIGAAKIVTPWGESWRQNRAQVFPVGHPRLDYFLRTRQFHCDPICRPAKAGAETGKAGVGKVSSPLEPSPPPAARTNPDAVDTVDLKPAQVEEIELKDDKELRRMLKAELVEYAHSVGLKHVTDDGFTATEIRAEIDKLR